MADHEHTPSPSHAGCSVNGGHAEATDPVCGMSVDPRSAKHRFAYKGENYFFCSGRCRERFEAEPDKFLRPKPPQPRRRQAQSTPARCIRR